MQDPKILKQLPAELLGLHPPATAAIAPAQPATAALAVAATAVGLAAALVAALPPAAAVRRQGPRALPKGGEHVLR